MERRRAEDERTVTAKGVPGCDFCAIALGRDSSADIVCEGRTWVAFFPLKPATPGHTLVIPRSHIENLWDVEPQEGADLMEAVVQVGRAISAAMKPEGLNLITSAGATAEQTVFHLHLHIVPRWRRDGFGRIWPVDTTFEDAELQEIAARIRDECNRSQVDLT